ncbi:MAG: nitronate monooxygenase [Zetaproteobacteria bacterium]|nr:nitronate monooxygenase [Pseudobdellovibrionaceae bacterium]
MISNLPRKQLCQALSIQLPIIQAGMVWASGAKLAAAASNAGALGVIGAGSMDPDLLRQHIQKSRLLSNQTIAVNIPLLYQGAKQQLITALEEGIQIFITSAGNPKTYTQWLKQSGAVVLHVVSSPYLAEKCEDAGVDIIIAEGFEAGGHNGYDELTTMCLIPQVVSKVKLPVVAAGGIASGAQIAAAFSLGASGVQIGSRFLATKESSAHIDYKKMLLKASHDSTKLCMKSLTPVRLLKNAFYYRVNELEQRGARQEELKELLGKGRAKRGMFEGDLLDGELEIGQVCADINDIPSCQDLVERLVREYNSCVAKTFS